jgi:hydroxylaminobenzene mutase
MQTVLFELGLVLFLLGLLTGFAVPALKNPRMALSSHLEAVLNGMFLVLLGLLWPHVDLPRALAVTAVGLIVYSGYANWMATLLAAAWGAGRKLAPIAAGDHQATAVKEGVVGFLLVTLSLSMVVGVGIVIAGVMFQ